MNHSVAAVILLFQNAVDNTAHASRTATSALNDIFNMITGRIPYIIVGVGVLVLFMLLAAFFKRGAKYLSHRTGLDSMLISLIGRLTYFGTLLIGVLVAVIVIFPSFSFGDLAASLGVGSVALGFAFKDILQNLFAGMLLLLYRPFSIGDQIRLKDFEGTIEQVQMRASRLRTSNGELVLIPNSELYLNTVVVKTGYPNRRSSIRIGVPNDTNFPKVKKLLLKAIEHSNGLVDKPSPSVHIVDLAEDAVILELRFWTPSSGDAASHAIDDVTEKAKAALDKAKIEISVPKW